MVFQETEGGKKEWEKVSTNTFRRLLDELLQKRPNCARAQLFLVDLLSDDSIATNDSLNEALKMLDVLKNRTDRIRFKYYEYLADEIKKRQK